MQQIAITNT